jgi:hypothetical protein
MSRQAPSNPASGRAARAAEPAAASAAASAADSSVRTLKYQSLPEGASRPSAPVPISTTYRVKPTPTFQTDDAPPAPPPRPPSLPVLTLGTDTASSVSQAGDAAVEAGADDTVRGLLESRSKAIEQIQRLLASVKVLGDVCIMVDCLSVAYFFMHLLVVCFRTRHC